MVNTAYYLALFFIFIRLVTFFQIVKVFYPSGTPRIFKVALPMVISFFLVQTVDVSSVSQIGNTFSLICSIFSEVLTGLILGFMVNIIFEVAQVAGGMMDSQAGLSMMNTLDPTTKTNGTLLASLTNLIAVVLFFMVDGHHILIKCLAGSFDVVLPGQNIIFQSTFNIMLHSFVNYFIIGIRIALPVIIIVLLTDVCMALITRTVPTINVMVVGAPVRIIVGIISFTLALPVIIKILTYAFDTLPNVFSDILKSLPAVMLVFSADKDGKTEEATPQKLNDARKDGQIPKSKDINTAATMMAITLLVTSVMGILVGNLKDYLKGMLESGILQDLNFTTLNKLAIDFVIKFATTALPFMLPVMVVGIVATLAQTRMLVSTKPLKPSLKKLNPLKGFGNMFSKKSLADLGKNLIVVSIVIFLAVSYIKENYTKILQISNMYLPDLGKTLENLATGIFIKITILLVVIAVIDYKLQVRFYHNDLKMSKQEIKEEAKQQEGDPQIKGKRRQKQREIAMNRMMSAVPDATVVITNPTHLAIAIKYEDQKNQAPVVVAKGADLIALRIKDMAKENNVPVLENKPLARLMYEQVDIDQEIPQDMYQAVAEILALVYKMKK